MWHYLKDNQSVGPVDEAGMIQLIRSGAVTRETQVWSNGMTSWAPLASTPLAQHLAAASLTLAPASREQPKAGLPGWVTPVGGVVGAVIGFVSVKLAFKYMSAETFGMFLGGAIAGALCGLLPYLIGRKRGHKLAKVSMAACVLSGLALGIILALPVAIIFTAIILSQKSNLAG